jgi:DNA-binding SARP family transcriptional activator
MNERQATGAAQTVGRPVIRLFGSLSIDDGACRLGPRDLGGARPKQILEILLAARGHVVPTDRLAELVWGDQRPRNVASSLQTFVSMLRRHLAADRERARALVVTEPEAYRFATELVALDLDRFDELLERSAHEPTHLARRSLEQALTLVRGEVMEDEPYATWAMDLRGSYQGRVLGAHLDAAEAALAELDFAPALAHADAAAQLDGFSERAQRYQMLALYALGRAHEALSSYRDFRKRLDAELGLEPTAETRALESAVLRQEDVRTLLPRPLRRAHADGDSRAIRLLGRTAERDRLVHAVRRGLDGGLAVIQIEGERGLGKTRLLDELVGALGAVRVGRASCSELERHLPYVPLATALRDALADVELDPRRLPALAQILPELTLDAPGRAFEEVEALEALVALVAAHAPLVLLLDDLQWADPKTLAAIGYLQRRGTRLSAALVTTARSTETSRDDQVRLLTPDTLIRLEPLSASDLAPLGIPELHESTGGNPRFIAEALEGARPAGASRSITDALLAQCRAQGAWGHRVLVAASVLEQPFEPEPLADLLTTDPTELTEELERLCEQRILRIDGLRFRFRYDLIRQVLFGTVSPARRRLLQQRLEHRAAETAPLPFPIGRVIGTQAG